MAGCGLTLKKKASQGGVGGKQSRDAHTDSPYRTNIRCNRSEKGYAQRCGECEANHLAEDVWVNSITRDIRDMNALGDDRLGGVMSIVYIG